MLWNDFLNNIRIYKKDFQCGQLRIDYGTLSTLLYAGAFDSMFEKQLSLEEIQIAAFELKAALGSQAEPKEAKKNEMFGIADIDSQVRLLLWRNQNLPTTKFELALYFKNALSQLGFTENASLDNPYKNAKTDLWLSWNQVISDHKIHRYYLQRTAKKHPGFVGMIEEVTPFTYKEKKEALRFKLFTGIDYVPAVAWPGRSGKLNPDIKKAVVAKQYGLASVRLSEYRNELTASLISWNTIRV